MRISDWSSDVCSSDLIRFGPAGLYRFGRGDVDDDVVDRLPSIDATVELGGFAGLEFIDADDPRTRIYLSVDFLHDVADEPGGYVVSASARLWYPLALATDFAVSLPPISGDQPQLSP